MLSSPFAWCEVRLFEVVSTLGTLSTFDAICANASIGAEVRQLSRTKALIAQPAQTLGALPRGTCCLLQVDALFAVFA